MAKLFPTVVKPAELKGIVRIIKESDGSVKLSKLSKAIHKDIDGFLPLLDACVLLGIAKIEDGSVVLTEQGRKLTLENIDRFIEKRLSGIEPFKSVLAVLKKEGELTTVELSELLKEKGIMLHTETEINTALLRESLFRWAISYHMLERNTKRDSWSPK